MRCYKKYYEVLLNNLKYYEGRIRSYKALQGMLRNREELKGDSFRLYEILLDIMSHEMF